MLYCGLCKHNIDSSRVDSANDHLESKKHSTRNCSKQKLSEIESSSLPSTSRQVTPSSIVKSKDLREDFALADIKLCLLVDIPLLETGKMRPFLKKYSGQAGSLPQVIYSSQDVCTISF